jgi:transcriptional regulator of arginine metabolism
MMRLHRAPSGSAGGAVAYHSRVTQEDGKLGKRERQRLIVSLVTNKRIGMQLELRDALAAVGCNVTQATISRDARELGLIKAQDALGRPRYLAPQRMRRIDLRETFTRMLGQFGRRVTAAGNLVVLATELGTAPAIARTLDRLQHPLVVGTVAGEDTLLVIANTADDASRLAAELTGMIG